MGYGWQSHVGSGIEKYMKKKEGPGVGILVFMG